MSNINIKDIEDDNSDFYANFKDKLIQVEEFPSMYTFKFILHANTGGKEQIEKIFEHPSSKISTKESKTGKYNSITVETFVNNADEVIDYYKEVSSIEKVIMM